jgi:hypothetical protein
MRLRLTSRRKIFPPPSLIGSCDSIVGIANHCRPDGWGSNPDGVRFSTTVQTGPRPPSLFSYGYWGSLPQVKQQGCGADHLYQVPRLSMGRAIPLFLPLRLPSVACYGAIFTFTFFKYGNQKPNINHNTHSLK